ncbi:MAG TPA: YidC/Oxa1 family membrane protein insertase, partial [Candidatus Saccharibacteria bacterium]|nr:YidC/Oxa1 family membrane protein insertase [Candidatus Saccharibacteria bacterium]
MDIFRTLIVEPVFNLLISIYSVVGDFGVALIIFTIIIRLLLWPLVTRQLHQVKAMRKLQPELAKIKKASKGNRQLESMQMLELYKKHGVKPFRSILMLLIQLPIFIALFQVIMIFTNSRDQIADYAYGFVENIPAVASLLQNPELFNQKLLGFIDLSASAFSGSDIMNSILLIVLAGLAAFTQYVVS